MTMRPSPGWGLCLTLAACALVAGTAHGGVSTPLEANPASASLPAATPAAATPRMRSLKVGGSAGQKQDASGNTQILSVDAAGGNIIQRQTGSGNFQSMTVGNTESTPVAVPAAGGR
jgi:hypothetical protein